MRWTPEQLDAWKRAKSAQSKIVCKRQNQRVRHEPGRMNKTEAAYAQVLEVQKHAGKIVDYKFESLKFRLAKKTFYTPDFFVVTHNGFEIHEVKGFWRDDARVKIKVVAEMFPWFKFVAVTKKKGSWSFENF